MQKKLITLAVAVAAMTSATAFAESNVTFYGSVDMGVSHRSDSQARGYSNQTAIDSGISEGGNRLGVEVTKDLDNSLTALLTLEAGFQSDTGVHGQDGRLFGRQIFIGLTGDFGTVIAGRLYTPHYSFMSTIDPFKAGTVGRYNNTYGNDITELLDPVRVDNAVAYVSPSFSGFNVTAAYSNNAIGQESEGSRHDQNRVYAILPRYTKGPIDVAVSYHIIDASEGSGVDDIRNWLIGGTYDFGAAKLAAFYSGSNIGFESSNTNDIKLKNYMVGVTVPFGKQAVFASYNHSEAEQGRLDGDSDQWALGWTYDLSNRINLYAAYASINNDENGDLTFARSSRVGDASNNGGANAVYQEGIQFGVRYAF